jgi:hypothetical protein
MVNGSVPGYPQNNATLASTTILRWITTLSGFTQSCRTALILVLQENPILSQADQPTAHRLLSVRYLIFQHIKNSFLFLIP